MSAYPLRPRRAGAVVLAMVVFLVMIMPALVAAADVFGFTPGRSFQALAAISSYVNFGHAVLTVFLVPYVWSAAEDP